MTQRPPVQPGSPWRFPRPDIETLGNGITVERFNLPSQRVVSVTALVDAPLSGEPSGREGVASLAMHVADEGTEHHPGAALTQALEDCGAATVGAGARLDGATLAVEAPSTRLVEALPLIGEIVTEPAFAPIDVARLKDDRLLAIATGEASPPTCATKAAYACFGDHRLARPIGGDVASVAALMPTDLRSWHQSAVRPQQLRLIIAGDLPEGTTQAIEAAFGHWPTPAAAPLPAPTAPPVPPGRRVVIVDRPAAEQVSVRLATLTPSRTSPDWPALQVANAVVGGMFGSRLNQVLREERGLTYGANTILSPTRDLATFMAQAECAVPSAVEAVTLCLSLLDMANPITPQEAGDAVAYISGVTPLRLDTASAVAAQAGEFALGGVPTQWFDDYIAALAKVTADQATQAFARHVRPENLVITLCGPADVLAPQLQAAGLDAEVVASASQIRPT